ncbi:pentapeptide repeat-containing protein, partial [archaeon]|nr:pentapeptide repeat-containing protein [archaeon]
MYKQIKKKLAKIKIEIKALWDNILFSHEKEDNTILKTLLEAIERGANLRRADLSGADLRGADLREADLSGEYLRGGDLGDLDLRDADLRYPYEKHDVL